MTQFEPIQQQNTSVVVGNVHSQMLSWLLSWESSSLVGVYYWSECRQTHVSQLRLGHQHGNMFPGWHAPGEGNYFCIIVKSEKVELLLANYNSLSSKGQKNYDELQKISNITTCYPESYTKVL